MHFYNTNGDSCHEIVGKNGKLRASTIRDARNNGWVPSVSTVKDLGVGYGLLEWMFDMLLESVLHNPFHPDEFEVAEWKKLVLSNFRREKSKPAERGSEIHDKLEKYYVSGKIDKKDREYLIPTIEKLDEMFPGVKWVPEASFCSFEHGFGGRVDLHSENIIIDFKTKDKTVLTNSMQYDDHRMQLCAYQVGLKLPNDTKRYNAFISTHKETPGQVLVVECEEFDKYWNMFYNLLKFWKIKNNYDPCEVFV